jgi:hypothetical protein
MARPKRKFHSISLKLTDSDLMELKRRVLISGLTQTEYILQRAIRPATTEINNLVKTTQQCNYVSQKLLMSILYELIKDKKLVSEYVDKLLQEAEEIKYNEEEQK